jgi:hypothetical protein
MKKRNGIFFGLLKGQSGSSLVTALFVSFVLISLVTIVIHFSNTDIRSAHKQEKQTSAFYLAEAGVHHAIQEINRLLSAGNDPLNLTLDGIGLHGGHYSVTVSEKLNEYGENVGYLIHSAGTYQGEEKKVTAWVRQPLWREDPAFDFVLFAEKDLRVRTISGLLGIGLIKTYEIRVDEGSNVHANEHVRLEHWGLFASDPDVRGEVSSTDISYIHVQGLSGGQKRTRDFLPLPEFDFDNARKKAKEEGVYIPGDALSLSVLELHGLFSERGDFVFIDGDLVGLSLLYFKNRTVVVNGSVVGVEAVGVGNLNLIAKENITFIKVAGLEMNGILYAGGEINIAGQAKVNGFAGAREIFIGSGLVSSVLGLITGDMRFTYSEEFFDLLPHEIGFKKTMLNL